VFRVSRDSRGSDAWLPAKLALLGVGAALGLAGMALDIGWIVTAGIVALGAGVLLAAAGRRRS
jgi:hypothetical protein